MSIEKLESHKNFAISTTNDIEISSHCSRCRSTSTILKFRNDHSRSFRKAAATTKKFSHTMNHKFLLIYALAFLVLSPSVILCLRHQDKPNESALSETTPLNSIDTRSSLFNDKSEISAEDLGDDGDDNDDDFNENDDDSYQKEHNQKLVVEMYRQQFEKQKQKDILKIEINDHQFTTMKPGRTTERSCLSSACLARKDLEQASRESIRQHILMKLGKINEPNQTRKYPNLPRQLLEQYCKRMDLSMDSCFGTTSHIVEYQSDGPIDSSYDDVFNGEQETITDEEDVQFLSFENRILAFPSTTTKTRHKSHLIFQFTESQETNNIVSMAKLNIFVHSKKFLRSNDVQLPKNLRLIDIEISKVLPQGSHKKIFKTFRNVSVPDGTGDGDFVQLNITDMVAEWFASFQTSHGLSVKILASKNSETLPHKVVSLDADNFATRPFIDILPRDQRKKRTKRSSLRCQKGSLESRCCRHELTVDFDKFGWDWIIAPKKYDANYCAGECKIAFMQQYAHTHVMQLSTAANPCCSPRKMTPMQLLYFDAQLNIVLGTIPNMIVDECFCS